MPHMEDSYARTLWTAIESIHVVTYFSPECVQAYKDVGLKGYWMGYFGSRAAPMGAVSPGVVEATFYGFHPKLVRRAIPDAWKFAQLEDILCARRESAAKVLRRLHPAVDEAAVQVNPLLAKVIEAAQGPGHPLFSANRLLPTPEDPVEALWQATADLREHRGDAHIAILVSEGIAGIESVVLAAAVADRPLETLTQSRGWSSEELQGAVASLAARGLLDEGGTITEKGRAFRQSIEERTDKLAAPPYRVLDKDEAEEVFRLLQPVARAVLDSGEIPAVLVSVPRL
jgi:hypothetical protein